MNKLEVMEALRRLAEEQGTHLPLDEARRLADVFERKCDPVWEHPYTQKLPSIANK